MAYTSFGKFLRKLMIDSDQNLQDLAELFGVSVPFVSSVLMGKKNVPTKWIDIIIEYYDLTDEQIKELNENFDMSKSTIKIDLINCTSEQKNIAINFQRKLNNLSDKELKILKEILGESK